MRTFSCRRGFTLAEMMMTLFSIGILGMVLTLFTSTTSRYVSRNLATNHSHEATRISAQSLLKDMRDAASSFELVSFDGTSYTDVEPSVTSDKDVLTGQYASTRTNAVRFRQVYAGPLAMTAATTTTSTTLKFTFPAGTTLPVVGDKVVLPLITQEYDITGVSVSGTSVTVTLGKAVGYTLNVTSPNIVTGYFYRRVAFSVYNNELRFHSNFTGANANTYRVVRGGITSPQPFSVLFTDPLAFKSDATAVRVSLELTDLGYSQQKYANGTTTLYTVIPARNQPTPLSKTN